MSKIMDKIEKVVINTGLGRLSAQPNFSDKVFPTVTKEFATIIGQKPSPRQAKKSISGFKLRQGTIVGLKATLRRHRKEEFLNKIIKVVLPRVRDFHGLDSKHIDSQGNLSFGIKDHLVFPEITPEDSKVNFGIEVTLVPKDVQNHEEAYSFYKELGIPLQKQKENKKKKHG